jgi:hypothetical protein
MPGWRKMESVSEMRRTVHSLALVEGLSDAVLDSQGDSHAWTIRRLLRHLGNAEEWYVIDRPASVVTAGSLNALPYDLWQQGHRVTLELHDLYPNLASPVVRALTSTQRWRLSQAPAPTRRLGRRATAEYVLRGDGGHRADRPI